MRTDDLSIQPRWDMGRELEEAGYPGMASAVRPMALAPDERFVYLQVSFFHGWIEFDTQAADLDGTTTYDGEPTVGAVTRVVDLPKRTTEPRENYVLDSAHHGMAMNAAGTTLCAAGTMDGYAAIVDRETEAYELVDVGEKPYWSTNGPVGESAGCRSAARTRSSSSTTRPPSPSPRSPSATTRSACARASSPPKSCTPGRDNDQVT